MVLELTISVHFPRAFTAEAQLVEGQFWLMFIGP